MGIEPIRSYEPRILSPLCLPVPSLRHKNGFCKSRTCLVRLTVLSTNRCTKNPKYVSNIIEFTLYEYLYSNKKFTYSILLDTFIFICI